MPVIALAEWCGLAGRARGRSPAADRGGPCVPHSGPGCRLPMVSGGAYATKPATARRPCAWPPKSGLLRGPGPLKILQRDALAVLVAGLPEDGGGVLVGGDRLVEPPHLPQGNAEVVQGRALAVPVAGLPEDGGGVLAGGDRLIEPPHLHQGQAEGG